MTITQRCTSLALAALLLLPTLAQAFEITDIRVEGLRTISPGTVFTYIPYEVGDDFQAGDSTRVVEALYDTGFFKDVEVGRGPDDALLIRLQERPTITALEVNGNEKVETEKLQEALKSIGLVQGRVLDQRALDKMQTELQRVYYSLGQYGVQIETEVEELEDNRVFVNIEIYEGKPASIRRVRIIGNEDFDEDELLDQFELGPVSWWRFWSSADQYSKQKLSADLERLRSFYLDRGYLKFAVDSTQVTITPDKKDIEVVVNITEGERYKVEDVTYSGNMLLNEETLEELTQVEVGEYFSRRQVVDTSDAIGRRMGDYGYAFARVEPRPDINEDEKTVVVDFNLEPGRRVSVREIEFKGNYNTNEVVYRREMRQMEGSWYAGDKLDRSKQRLERLPSVERVEQEVSPVPDAPDQVDIEYDITEQLSGSLTAGVGFSQAEGVLFNAGLNQPNFLGTGKEVGINVERSSYREYYQFNYRDPYFTVNGVSQGFGLFYQKQDGTELSLSRYLVDSYGGNINFGVPLSELTYGSIAFGVESQEIKATTRSPTWVTGPQDDVDDNPGPGFDGEQYYTYTIKPSWRYDSRNRHMFPTAGQYHRLTATLAVPGSDLTYVKGEYDGEFYLPLTDMFTLQAHGNVGQIKAYGDTENDYSGVSDYYDGVPPFLNYFTGGIRSVRGYEDYSLGPRDNNNDPMGGTFKVNGGLAIYSPLPFLTEQRDSVRMSLFWDIGNAYRDIENFEADTLRQSVGVGLSWISPVGPLMFSFAQPLNDEPEDRTQSFQFSIGASF
ncbi:outer membrane protein assembly factor BamA [Guyparkeria sp. SCN-R1]|uniref:outer membrane protein assembly factor BamA n=1 Tax=Guyparkeria sp. SCN-R1 TaxID=2341113 RepID=UPI000F645534|nr:outer membrane protein assembly factor BamA [Guyparkeria sp. SCN-R1]RRQ24702.1 outer membrane protein assembly factor BamA [Guyparkeria sp. SCN-R1]